MRDFKPTHTITLTEKGGATESIEVMLDEGCAYTREEWDTCSASDWCTNVHGNWLFQGRTTPRPGLEVAVKRLVVANKDDIRELRLEASIAGDMEQVVLCDRALDGDEEAWARCADSKAARS